MLYLLIFNQLKDILDKNMEKYSFLINYLFISNRLYLYFQYLIYSLIYFQNNML